MLSAYVNSMLKIQMVENKLGKSNKKSNKSDRKNGNIKIAK